MSEFQETDAFQWRPIPFEARIGHKALGMTVHLPIAGDREPTGKVYTIITGLAARQSVYRALAVAGARRGNTMITTEYSGCSDDGVRAIEYMLSSIEDGSFQGEPVPVAETDEIIVYGHSFGPWKAVGAKERMRERSRGTRINKMVMGAAACLGGVHSVLAPLHAAHSFAQETRYIERRALEHRGVAVDATLSILSLGPNLPRELHRAMHSSMEPRIAELQAEGMQFAAVDHNDDVLVRPAFSRPAYNRLGITPVNVRTEQRHVRLAGHVVPLYHPEETFEAILEAEAGMDFQLKKAS